LWCKWRRTELRERAFTSARQGRRRPDRRYAVTENRHRTGYGSAGEASGARIALAYNAIAEPPAAKPLTTCNNPDALGLSRVVEIDTMGRPAFGTEHFKQYDFLHEKEVVLTFDDGPWPENTAMVLKALQDNCIKATFFEIGEHATWRPDLTRALVSAGMTVGSHTWSHKDLAKNPYAKDIEQAKQEIEMGVSAVHMAACGPIAPFFRFPDLQQPPELIAYLGSATSRSFRPTSIRSISSCANRKTWSSRQ
jgi:hypothetical protein